MATRKRRTAVRSRRVKLPSKFTLMPVRVNPKGEVQIKVPAGSRGRFAHKEG